MSGTERKSNLFKVAIIGAASLKGKEVSDALSERNFPAVDIKLLDEEDALGQLEQVNDEPTFIQSVSPEQLEGVDFAFLAADQLSTSGNWSTARDAGCDLIDLSYALENNTDVELRAPWVERELGHVREAGLKTAPVVVAHPAAVTLALLLARLQKTVPLRVASAVIGQPASEYGRRGMDELHDQTVNLLSFQQMPTTVFGAQAAFNMYAQPVVSAQPTLAESEARIVRHFEKITGGTVIKPSVLLVQTPVFHGCTMAIFLLTEHETKVATLQKALDGPHVGLSNDAEDYPSNVNIAGVDKILASVREDGAGGNGFWLFAACDNLRLPAMLAVECAEEMALTRPRGTLQ